MCVGLCTEGCLAFCGLYPQDANGPPSLRSMHRTDRGLLHRPPPGQQATAVPGRPPSRTGQGSPKTSLYQLANGSHPEQTPPTPSQFLCLGVFPPELQVQGTKDNGLAQAKAIPVVQHLEPQSRSLQNQRKQPTRTPRRPAEDGGPPRPPEGTPPRPGPGPAGLSSCSGGPRPLVELCVEPAGPPPCIVRKDPRETPVLWPPQAKS